MKKLNREVILKFASRFFLVLMSFMLILSLCSMSATSTTYVIPAGTYTFLDQPYNDALAEQYPFTTLVYDINISAFIDDVLISGDSLEFSYYETEEHTDKLIWIATDFDTLYEYGVNDDWYIDGFYNGWNRQIIVNEPCYCTEFEYRYFMSIVDVPAPRITSVWTSITNWVISSLNTVQGVFYNTGIEYYVNPLPEAILSYDGNSYGFVDYDYFSSFRYVWYDGTLIDKSTELSISPVILNGSTVTGVFYNGIVLLLNDGNNWMAIDNGLLGVSNTPNPNSLTLLGTLAIIGLSISLAFLLIGVIQRFLKLRG